MKCIQNYRIVMSDSITNCKVHKMHTSKPKTQCYILLIAIFITPSSASNKNLEKGASRRILNPLGGQLNKPN